MEEEILDKLETVEQLLEEGKLSELKELLTGHPADIADILDNMSPSRRILIFRLLPKDEAVEVFEYLDVEKQSELLSGFTEQRIVSMVNEMSPDDRAWLFDELPAKVVKKLLSQMNREEWLATSVLLGFEEHTAGRIMTPEYVDLNMNMTVADALKRVKRTGHAKETIYYLYVINDGRRLIGVVSLKNVVLSQDDTKVIDIMNPHVIKVFTDDDQENVAQVFKDYDLLALPVVDKEEKLVGIITVDDIVDIIEQEATEDMLRMSGVETADRGYFKSSMVVNFSKRIVWLIVLLTLYTVTGNIMVSYQNVIQGMVILSAFIPILIGTGGNAGSQSSTVVIRGLAIGEIEQGDVIRIILREFIIGIALGLFLGTAAFLWAYFLQGKWEISFVVGSSLVAIITLATTLGTILPLIVKRLGFDPAFMATPFITTAIDVGALLIYFGIAKKLLGL
jgi:magnesium transporter